MKEFCPACNKVSVLEKNPEKEKVLVRGEDIEVNYVNHTCGLCGNSFETTRNFDVLDEAYRIYRKCHSMLQPEDIKAWRQGLGLTQKELADLFNWGVATLSRYENGSLQRKDHDKFLQIASNPVVLSKLIRDNPAALSDQKREKLISELKSEAELSHTFERIYEDYFATYKPSVLSGFKKLDIEKMFNSILFFCKGGQWKVKLNKLLFYADFKSFKDYTISITGARYLHLPLGPVPDKFDYYFATLVDCRKLLVNEVGFGNGTGIEYNSLIEPDLSVFEEIELKILLEIKDYFKNYTSAQIKDFSHNELGYQQTDDNEIISYAYAEQLSI